MVFETKKIERETLGEYLTKVRKDLELSSEEVSRRLGVKPAMLAALELGEYGRLPADVYVTGFLRRLAVLYAIDPAVLVEQYKKEKNVAQALNSKTQVTKSVVRQWWQRFVITPKILAVAVGGTFVVVTMGYVIWQVYSINQNPSLDIQEPKDRQVIAQSSVLVAGKTDPGMSVTINNQSVFVDSSGNFKTQLGISPGPKELIFVAKNKFDRTVSRTITILGEEPVNQSSGVVLGLLFESSVELEYSVDERPAVTQEFAAGATTTIEALRSVVLSTSNAGATKLIYNGQDIGALGKEGEELTDIPFSAQSGSIK